jgi:hypothetical protein
VINDECPVDDGTGPFIAWYGLVLKEVASELDAFFSCARLVRGTEKETRTG